MPTHNRTMALSIWLLAGLAVLRCSPRPSGDQPEAAADAPVHSPRIVGTWSLESVPRGTSPGRMMLDLRIDSVTGTQLHGQLVHYFAGDVGADAATFPRLEGEIRDDSLVHIAIHAAARPNAGFLFTGVVRADTIALTTFVVGPDTVSGHDRRWRLVSKQD